MKLQRSGFFTRFSMKTKGNVTTYSVYKLYSFPWVGGTLLKEYRVGRWLHITEKNLLHFIISIDNSADIAHLPSPSLYWSLDFCLSPSQYSHSSSGRNQYHSVASRPSCRSYSHYCEMSPHLRTTHLEPWHSVWNA